MAWNQTIFWGGTKVIFFFTPPPPLTISTGCWLIKFEMMSLMLSEEMWHCGSEIWRCECYSKVRVVDFLPSYLSEVAANDLISHQLGPYSYSSTPPKTWGPVTKISGKFGLSHHKQHWGGVSGLCFSLVDNPLLWLRSSCWYHWKDYRGHRRCSKGIRYMWHIYIVHHCITSVASGLLRKRIGGGWEWRIYYFCLQNSGWAILCALCPLRIWVPPPRNLCTPPLPHIITNMCYMGLFKPF